MSNRCTKCILPSNFQFISFDDQGVCSYCRTYKSFKPRDENILLQNFQRAKKKGRAFDALVPLSGGKDSTYVLFLAKKKYNLNVLAYTFDNGFLSDSALKNINSAVNKLNVDHFFYRPGWITLKKLYRASLLASGELCSVCGIGLTNAYLKLSEAWHIPIILLGGSATETNSILFEKIYDIRRFKYILRNSQDISTDEIHRFLIYSELHPYYQIYRTRVGKFGRIFNPLFYQSAISEMEMINLLKEQLDFQDAGKHADCIAEPFSNYIREHRYGYSRRVPYYSNLIREGELSREKALELLARENPAQRSRITERARKLLEISDEELSQILTKKPLEFQDVSYRRNRVVDKGLKLLKI